MATNAGIIGILRFQWGVTNLGEERYAIKSVSDGKHELQEIGPDVTKDGDIHLAGESFPKVLFDVPPLGETTRRKNGTTGWLRGMSRYLRSDRALSGQAILR